MSKNSFTIVKVRTDEKKMYDIHLYNLEQFVHANSTKFNLTQIDNIVRDIQETFIDNYPPDREAGRLKVAVQFLKELEYLFTGLIQNEEERGKE